MHKLNTTELIENKQREVFQIATKFGFSEEKAKAASDQDARPPAATTLSKSNGSTRNPSRSSALAAITSAKASPPTQAADSLLRFSLVHNNPTQADTMNLSSSITNRCLTLPDSPGYNLGFGPAQNARRDGPGRPDRRAFRSPPAEKIQREERQEQSMVKATLLRPGMIIQHEGDLYSIFSVDHRTPGNKRGSMQTKMRNLRSGAIVDYRFRAEDFVERAVLDEVEYEYLYSDSEGHHFMNSQTYEQMALQKDILGDAVDYLIPNLPVKLEFHQGKPIGVLLPDTVDLTVVETEPSIQKATASAVMKPAKLETGLVINVPPFVGNGDKVKVDTSEARYIQRVQ